MILSGWKRLRIGPFSGRTFWYIVVLQRNRLYETDRCDLDAGEIYG